MSKKEISMEIHFPTHSAIHQPIEHDALVSRLLKLYPNLDPNKLEIVQFTQMTWNNGSLGCPIEGHNYTQALVPGYLIVLKHEDQLIEVHTDSWLRSFAIPGIGFI